MFLDFDAGIPVAYNAFADADAQHIGRLTTEYVHILKHLFDAAGFHRMSHFLGMGIYALFLLSESLALLPVLFAKTPRGERLRRQVIATATNGEVLRFWQDEYPHHRPDAFAPITNRLSALLLDDNTYRTFSQRENRVHIAEFMDTGKVVIIAPPASPDVASIVGGMLIAQAKLAAFRRAGTPDAAQHFHFVIDEFHRFLSSSQTLEALINETTKGGLSVLLANQETGQLPADLLKAAYSVGNVFVFGVNYLDAKQLAHLFNGQVSPETLAGQCIGEVYARIGHEIVNFRCPPPLSAGDPAIIAGLIAASISKYHTQAQPSVQEPVGRSPRVIDTFEEET